MPKITTKECPFDRNVITFMVVMACAGVAQPHALQCEINPPDMHQDAQPF
jgi:hypothetical protein